MPSTQNGGKRTAGRMRVDDGDGSDDAGAHSGGSRKKRKVSLLGSNKSPDQNGSNISCPGSNSGSGGFQVGYHPSQQTQMSQGTQLTSNPPTPVTPTSSSPTESLASNQTEGVSSLFSRVEKGKFLGKLGGVEETVSSKLFFQRTFLDFFRYYKGSGGKSLSHMLKDSMYRFVKHRGGSLACDISLGDMLAYTRDPTNRKKDDTQKMVDLLTTDAQYYTHEVERSILAWLEKQIQEISIHQRHVEHLHVSLRGDSDRIKQKKIGDLDTLNRGELVTMDVVCHDHILLGNKPTYMMYRCNSDLVPGGGGSDLRPNDSVERCNKVFNIQAGQNAYPYYVRCGNENCKQECKYTLLQAVTRDLHQLTVKDDGDSREKKTLIVSRYLVKEVKAGDRLKITGFMSKNPCPASSVQDTFQVCGLDVVAHEDRSPDSDDNIDWEKFVSEREYLVQFFREKYGKDVGDATYEEILKRSLTKNLFTREGKDVFDPLKSAILYMFISVDANGEPLKILVIGDPGIGKTTVTKDWCKLEDIFKSTTGSGNSKAGLTAACIPNPRTKRFEMHMGTLTKFHGGLVVIDEINASSSETIRSLLEPLKHNMVTFAKADNCNAPMCASCAVFAMGNCFTNSGKIDPKPPLSDQMYETPILGRMFDLYFKIQDDSDPGKDRHLAENVTDSEKFGDVSRTPVGNKDVYLRTKHMNSLLKHMRKRPKPIATESAINSLSSWFEKTIVQEQALKDCGVTRTFVLDVRVFGSMLAIAEADARMYMSDEIKDENVQRAISLYHESTGQANNYEYIPYLSGVGREMVELLTQAPKFERDIVGALAHHGEGLVKNLLVALTRDRKIIQRENGSYMIMPQS